jgi:hypothetical protein
MTNGNKSGLASDLTSIEDRLKENFLRQLSTAEPHRKDPPMNLLLNLIVVLATGIAGVWTTTGFVNEFYRGRQWSINDFFVAVICDGLFVAFTHTLLTRSKKA